MKKFLFILAIVFMPLIGFSQSVMSVGDLLKLSKYLSAKDDSYANILEKYGYNRSYQKSDTQYYFYKNCRLLIALPNNSGVEIEASPKNEKATFIYLSFYEDGGYISVESYGKANFNKWVAQLKALGYKENGNSGEGTRGRSWEYSKRGLPDVSIWNDYDSTYQLCLNFK